MRLAELAEILRGSYWAEAADLPEIFRRAQNLLPEFPVAADIAELVATIGKTRDLSRRQERHTEANPE